MNDSPRGGGELAPATPQEILDFILENAPMRLFEVDANGRFVMNNGQNPPGGAPPGALVGIDARAAYRDFPEGLAALEVALGGTKSEVRYSRDGRTFDLTLVPRRNAQGELVSV